MKIQRNLNEGVRKHLQSIKSQSSVSKKLLRALVKARIEVNKADYPVFIQGLNNLDVDRLMLLPKPKKELQDIFKYRPLKSLSLNKELEWQFTYLTIYLNQFQKYISFSKEVEERWLNDDLNNIAVEIDRIEELIGKSLRLTEVRVSLWKELEQKEAIQDFFENFKKNQDSSRLLVALIALIIERNEEEVYLPRYLYRMERFLEHADFVLENLIRYCIGHLEPKSDDGWAAVLSSVATAGIVDLYEAFFECCDSKINQIISENKTDSTKNILLSNEDETFIKQIIRYSSTFSELGDTRFKEILLKIEISELLNFESEDLTETVPDKSEFSEFIRALCYDESLDPNIHHYGFWSKFWISGKRLVEKQENIEQEAYSIIKYSLNNIHLSFSNGLGYFGFSLASKASYNSVNLSVALINPQSKLYPLYINSSKDELSTIGWESLVHRNVCSDSFIYDYSNKGFFELTSFTESILIQLDLKKISTSQAVSLFEAIPLKLPYLKAQLNKLKFDEALTIEDYRSAIEIACLTCVENISRTSEFGLHELVGMRDWDFFAPMSNSMIVSISLYLYLQEFDNPDAHFNLRLSLDEFLMENNSATPSALLEKELPINNELLIFFLDFVCINEYLEFVSCLNQTRLIEEERREILKWLVVQNPKKRSEYEDEIKGISARLTVDDGLKEFDRSRVHVDLLGIYKWAEKYISEDYDRLQTLIRSNINIGIDAYVLLEKAILDSAVITREMLGLEQAKSPIEIQTLKLIRIIFDQFNNNKPYGLDTHLSLRIRHGSYRGNIRSVLEVHGLISTKEKATGSYSIPELWLKGLGSPSSEQRRHMQKAFDIFGKKVDAKIDEYINKIIQIRTHEKGEGVFYITFNELDVKLMSSSAVSGTTSKEFIDHCFLMYLASLEDCLQIMRNKIEREFKPQMVGFIAELEASLKQTLNAQFDLTKERSIADGRKQLTDVIDKVRDWFTFFDYRSTSKLYTVEEMADVAIAAVSNARKGNDRFITKVIDEYFSTVKFRNLETVVDPLFILLENAEKYGDVSESNPINLKIHVVDHTKLRLFVENKLKPNTNIDELQQKLIKIDKEIKGLGSLDRLVAEGGTGLVKLSRMGMLTREKDTNETISFGVDTTSQFFNASIDLDFKVTNIDE